MLRHLQDYFFPHPRNNHRPHLFSATSVAALVAVIVLFEAGYLAQTKLVFLKTDLLASVLPGALVALTNEDRAQQGLAGVTEDALLDAAAQAVAEDMAARNYFAHVSPEGKTPWRWLDEAGYRYSYAGQNLAMNFTDSANVETAWMGSPSHRANIVNPAYTRVGFGTAVGVYEGKETVFVVEFFATPTVSEKVAVASPAQSAPAIEPQPPTTAPVQVLGTETVAPTPPSLLARVLASPLSALMAILTALFVVVTLSFAAALLVRGRVQHTGMVAGGVLLLALIPAVMLASALAAGPVQLPEDALAASVHAALP